MRGKQRYRCKACGLNVTDTPPRGLPLKTNGAQLTSAGWVGAADPRSEGAAVRE